MNVNATGNQPISSVAGSEDKRASLQTLLLKRVLEAQEREAAEVVRQIEGKGQVLDIRV